MWIHTGKVWKREEGTGSQAKNASGAVVVRVDPRASPVHQPLLCLPGSLSSLCCCDLLMVKPLYLLMSPWEAKYSRGFSDQYTRARNHQRITRTGLLWTLPNVKWKTKRKVVYFNIYVSFFPQTARITTSPWVSLALPAVNWSFNGKREHVWGSKDPSLHLTPCGACGKEPACRCRRHKRSRFNLWVW